MREAVEALEGENDDDDEDEGNRMLRDVTIRYQRSFTYVVIHICRFPHMSFSHMTMKKIPFLIYVISPMNL